MGVSQKQTAIYTYTHTHTYIYVYIYLVIYLYIQLWYFPFLLQISPISSAPRGPRARDLRAVLIPGRLRLPSRRGFSSQRGHLPWRCLGWQQSSPWGSGKLFQKMGIQPTDGDIYLRLRIYGRGICRGVFFPLIYCIVFGMMIGTFAIFRSNCVISRGFPRAVPCPQAFRQLFPLAKRVCHAARHFAAGQPIKCKASKGRAGKDPTDLKSYWFLLCKYVLCLSIYIYSDSDHHHHRIWLSLSLPLYMYVHICIYI